MRFHLVRGLYRAVKTIRSPQTLTKPFSPVRERRQRPKLLLHVGQENICSCGVEQVCSVRLPPGVVLTPEPTHTFSCA